MPTDAPLFDSSNIGGTCVRCKNLGLYFAPTGFVATCPAVESGDPDHAAPSPSAKMVHRAIELLRGKQHPIDSRTFEIARYLADFSTDAPCDREDLLNSFFSYLPMSKKNQLRKFHLVIEELRKVWLLPVGSRKDPPSGYWIITDQKDFEGWYQRAKAAPLTQLTTIYKLAKRSFPIFAEQIEIEFFNDTEPPPPTAVAA